MLIYLSAALLSSGIAVLLNMRATSLDRRHRIILYIPLLPYLFVSIFRLDVGRDTVGEWSTYPRIFSLIESNESYENIINEVSTEPLFYLINKIVVLLGGDLQVVLIVMSAIFLIFMYKFILHSSESIPLSLFLLVVSDYFLFAQSGIRQAAATAIVFYALRYATSKRWGLYFLWIVLATGLHLAAGAFFFVYFIARRRISVGIVLAIVGSGVFLTLVPGVVRGLMGLFYGDAYFGSKWDSSNFDLIPAAITAVLVVAGLASQRTMVQRKPEFQVHLNLSLINLFLMIISPLLITPIRLYYLLIPSAFVLIPAILKSIPVRLGPLRPLAGGALTIVLSMQLVYELSIGNDAYGVWEFNWIFGS